MSLPRRIPAGEIKHWRVNKFSAQTKKIDFTLEPKGRHPFRVTGQFNGDFTEIAGDFQMPIGHGAKMAGSITLNKQDTWPTNPSVLGTWASERSDRPSNKPIEFTFAGQAKEKKHEKRMGQLSPSLNLQAADLGDPEWEITALTGLDWDADEQRWFARLDGTKKGKAASIYLEVTWDGETAMWSGIMSGDLRRSECHFKKKSDSVGKTPIHQKH